MCFLWSVSSLIEAASTVLVIYLVNPEISITYWKIFDMRVGPGKEGKKKKSRMQLNDECLRDFIAANFVGRINQ